jgi:hypothetical protein
MPLLDVFALFVLAALLLAAIVVFAALGSLPGRVAHTRKHPQADAIAVGGWLGMLFGGVLWPVMMIWAYAAGCRTYDGAESKTGERKKRTT